MRSVELSLTVITKAPFFVSLKWQIHFYCNTEGFCCLIFKNGARTAMPFRPLLEDIERELGKLAEEVKRENPRRKKEAQGTTK